MTARRAQTRCASRNWLVTPSHEPRSGEVIGGGEPTEWLVPEEHLEDLMKL
jgi:hypothetical protein